MASGSRRVLGDATGVVGHVEVSGGVQGERLIRFDVRRARDLRAEGGRDDRPLNRRVSVCQRTEHLNFAVNAR